MCRDWTVNIDFTVHDIGSAWSGVISKSKIGALFFMQIVKNISINVCEFKYYSNCQYTVIKC